MMFKNIFSAIVIILTIVLYLYLISVNIPGKPSFDIIIKNGLIVDGHGTKPYRADIGIFKDRIIKIGKLGGKRALKFIDAANLRVCPGFIDILTHADEGILNNPDANNYIRQGVTTVVGVVGDNYGDSPGSIGELLSKVRKKKITLNFGTLIGYNAIRSKVLGNIDRVPGKDDIKSIVKLVEKALQDGAVGFSVDLKCIPGAYARAPELIEVAKVVRRHGGLYAAHLRNDGLNTLESLREIIEIARAANLPVHISHHQITSIDRWGSSTETLAMIDNARKAHIDISLDNHPYTAINTGLMALFPTWALAGDKKDWPPRWNNPKLKPRLVDEIKFNIQHDCGAGDLNRIMLVKYAPEPGLEGLTLTQILARKAIPLTLGNAAEMIIQLQLKGMPEMVRALFFCLGDSDMERILKYPSTIVSSGGEITTYREGKPHPGCYGTFPRVLMAYVREKGLLTFEEAVKKMTWLPARRLGLKERGCIAEGFYADITIVDPSAVADTTTWQNPHQYPKGIPYVLVNGKPVVENNEFRGFYPGMILYGKQSQ